MKIFEMESELFKQWANGRRDFVPDGIVSEHDYIAAQLKLCFILKEVNDEGSGGWDLRKFIRDGSRGHTWNNITRWVICINDLYTDTPWQSIESIDKEQRANLLRTICAMNLKKYPGASTTVTSEFQDYVESDQSYIRKQYSFYKPDLTICCGTGWDFRYALGLNDEQIFRTSNDIEWFKNTDGAPVIVYKHPQARVLGADLVYELVVAIREILAC